MAEIAATIEPSEYDLVVLGTGLVESLVAAAASKAGKSLLQLDPAGFYGGAWASLQLDEFLQALGERDGSSGGGSSSSRDKGKEPTHSGGPLKGREEEGVGPASSGGGAANKPGRGTLAQSLADVAVLRAPGVELGRSGQYCLDLAPKVLYGAGPMIDLLLGSGAHNYTEFKLVQGSYLWEQGQLRPVPASRSEVFKDRSLGLAQKRALMKFLKAASEALQGEGPLQDSFDDRPFSELMASQGLETSLQSLLLHAVLMQDHAQQAQHVQREQQARQAPSTAAGPVALSGGQQQDGEQQEENGGRAQQGTAHQAQQGPITAAAALRLLGLYFRSVGRYGQDTGPFLTPMYGCGELPQAFCRVAAVGGAVQVLRCGVEGLIFDEHTFSCIGVELASGQVIRCQALAASQDFLHEWLSTFHPNTTSSATHHCFAVLEGPLIQGEQQSLLVLPPGALGGGAGHAGHATNAVRGLALSASTRVCPEGRYVLHLWTPADAAASQGAALDALRSALDALVDTSVLQSQAAAVEQQQHWAAKQEQAGEQQQEKVGAGAGSALPAPAAEHDVPNSSNGIDGGRRRSLEPLAHQPPAAAAALGVTMSPGRPRALLAGFYTHSRQSIGRNAPGWPANTVLCPGPDHSATFLSAVEEARACFARLYPEEEGFPLDPSVRDPDADSDEEALEALQAALGRVAAGGDSGAGAAEGVVTAAGEAEAEVAVGGEAAAGGAPGHAAAAESAK